MQQKKEIINKLRSSNLRPTKQRILIAKKLFDRKKTFHFTAETLNQAVNKKGDIKISLATIYNTVEAFKKAGHIREILTNNSKSYYDTNIKSHHHFYDSESKKLTDIDYQDVILDKIPNPPKGKKIKDLEVVISLQNK
ncbi:transcriptional repressor [Pelagibacterales bacterium SAG-MED05]|nr:transcriptional repressor [Pelagibacterales bacterium SAG-MED05]